MQMPAPTEIDPAEVRAAGSSWPAPGSPWGRGRKQGFGAAPQGRVWLTIADGHLSEVFYPSLERPFLRGLGFVLAARGADPVDDAVEAAHEVRWHRPGVPSFRVEAIHDEYRLTTEYVCDPDRDAILVKGDFRPEMPDLRLHLRIDPWPGPSSGAAVLDRDPAALAVTDGTGWAVLVGPLSAAMAGGGDAGDLVDELRAGEGELVDGRRTASGPGASAAARLAVPAGAFQFAIGFGARRDAAEDCALAALDQGFGAAQDRFADEWLALPELQPNVPKVAGDGGDLARASLAILRCLEDRDHPGAFVAAPAMPWGPSAEPGRQAYNRVRPRDLVQVALGLLAAGDPDAALRALDHLATIQLPDGSWPLAAGFDGGGEAGAGLDECAQPILLAWRLGVGGRLLADPWPPLVRPAAAHLVRTGPATPLDRWDEPGGLSVATLAACVAALVAAAEFAEDEGEDAAARHLRTVADFWHDRIDHWCYLRAFRQYVRDSDDLDAGASPDAVTSTDFLELARLGLRKAGDPRLEASLIAADALLLADLPGGRAWRRWLGDTYGEPGDGSDWTPAGGRGRAWPLLTGERAMYELAAGRPVADLVRALEAFAGPELMLPEQVWDGPELVLRGLRAGAPTGSASPLGWAHAEYLRLLVALAEERLPDVVEPARRRYARRPPERPAFVLSRACPIQRLEAGRDLVVQADEAGEVSWSHDGWRTVRTAPLMDTGLGVWAASLATAVLPAGAELVVLSPGADAHRLTVVEAP